MDNLLFAFASNDGVNFNKEHFGDSDYYYIYKIGQNSCEYIKKIANTTTDIEEELHADPRKAGGVSSMLKKENIDVVVSAVFGPNIKRINKKFVCIIMRNRLLDDSIEVIKDNYSKIIGEMGKDQDRSHLML